MGCITKVAVFPYGRGLLTTSMMDYNHLGQAWRVEWTINGERRAELDSSGVFTQMPDQITSQLFYGTSGRCESPFC